MDTSFISVRVLIPILFMIGCTGSTSEKSASSEQPESVKTAPKTVTKHLVEGPFHFSSKVMKDTFRIRLLGPDTLTTQVTFEIITARNEIIYQTTFSSTELIGFDAEDNNKKSDAETIIEGMNQFFGPDNFDSPAINLPEYDPEDYTMIDLTCGKK
jgi:hypothetical protein